jgi:hypothetical protein
MSAIKRLIERLERSGVVVMRKPPIGEHPSTRHSQRQGEWVKSNPSKP